MTGRAIKRPKVDDQLANGASAPTTVTHVYGSGQVIDVVDRLGRPWQFERAPAGWWTLLARGGQPVS